MVQPAGPVGQRVGRTHHCPHSLQHRSFYAHASVSRALRGRGASGPRRRSACSVAQEAPPAPPPAAPSPSRSHETDVVVIGSGIGGLCCAALLAHYGKRVTVLESHYHAGGAAHAFTADGYTFDSGPSFHAGLSQPGSSNPLKQVLDVIGESVPCVTYDRWIVYDDRGSFPCIAGAQGYRDNILRQGGAEALRQWEALEVAMRPLQAGAGLFPAAGMRGDLGALLTAGMFGVRAGWTFAQTGLQAGKLTGPFSDVVDKVVTDPWLRRFLDLECFVLSGMLAKDTITAEMAFMFHERNSPGATIDYPLGGSEALIDALVRGIEKNGGRVELRAHVDEILLEGGRAAGVRLQPRGSRAPQGEVVRGREAVVSNASIWDTQRFLPRGAAPAEWAAQAAGTPAIESFMHLHLGIDAEGLPEDLQCHHLFVNDWADLKAEQNVCIASIPTVFDPTSAPRGKATVHAYTAANEPWELWEGLDTRSAEYHALKTERSQCLWTALERVIPDIRARTELELVGSPLTHARFLRRHKGTYGPGISARGATFPGPKTPIPGLYGCGDSYMPGIGVPAAAASGMIAANTLVSVPAHLRMLSGLAL